MACLGPCVSCSKDSPLQGSCYFEEEGFEWSPLLSLHPDADTELRLMGVDGGGVLALWYSLLQSVACLITDSSQSQ